MTSLTGTKTPPGPNFSMREMLTLQLKSSLGLAPKFDPLIFSEENAKYGPVTKVVVGPVKYYQINHPDVVREVLVEKAAKFHKADLLKSTMKPLAGNGLLTSDGDFWKRQRKLAQPAFHMKRVQNYAETMISLTQKHVANWHDGATIPFNVAMMRLTLDIVTKTLFGADIGEQADAVAKAMPIALHTMTARINAPMAAPQWMPTPNNVKQRRAVDILDKVLTSIIEERRKSKEDTGDLLSMLMLAVDEDDGGAMNDRQLRDEVMTIFIAGHETTANALTWTFYLLSQNPAAEAKVLEEVDRVLAGRAPTFTDVRNLPYLDQVIKEAMRLYPPATGITRQPLEDVEIGGYTIPAGSLLLVSSWTMHRDPVFFANPEKFDPERFSPENEAKIHKHAYLPFGGGPRVCIGNMFAQMEAILAAAVILKRYRFSLAPGQKVQAEQVITTRPKYGMKMVAHAR